MGESGLLRHGPRLKSAINLLKTLTRKGSHLLDFVITNGSRTKRFNDRG